MATTQISAAPATLSIGARRALAVVAGAMLVAISAQFAVPMPGTPVPQTFQVPAVLLVGAVLGPGLGAASLALYLLAGAVGLPVFQPYGLPGLARLFGPTGGYLLSFPLAAAAVGYVISFRRAESPARRFFPIVQIALALVLGLVVIHASGVVQLWALGGDLSIAVQAGSFPFLATDAAKLLVIGLLIGKFGPRLRALL